MGFQDRNRDAQILDLQKNVRDLQDSVDQIGTALATLIQELQVQSLSSSQEEKSQVVKDELLNEPKVSIFRDTFGNVILNLNPGSPSAVQNLVISNAGVGGSVTISAVPQAGGDTDIDINFEPAGNGVLSVRGTPVQLQ